MEVSTIVFKKQLWNQMLEEWISHIDKASSFNRAHKPQSYVMKMVSILSITYLWTLPKEGVASTSLVLRVRVTSMEHFAETLKCTGQRTLRSESEFHRDASHHGTNLGV